MLRPICLTAVALAFMLSGCLRDESVTGYAAGQWRLTVMDDARVSTPITLDLTTRGRVSGAAPCNSYSATQTAPYPWFNTGPIVATRATCADQSLENRFLENLARMTLAEVAGPVLILNNDAGELMEFAQITN